MSVSKIINISALILSMLVTACSQTSDDSAPEAKPRSDVDEELLSFQTPATDELGSFERPVSGLALWQHPNQPSEGAILAANGEVGLSFINFQGGLLGTANGNYSDGVSLTYLPHPSGEKAFISAYNSETNRVDFFTTPNDQPFFEPLEFAKTNNTIISQTPHCFARSLQSPTIMPYWTDTNGHLKHASLSFFGSEIEISGAVEVNIEQGAISCTVNERTGDVFILTQSGTIMKTNPYLDPEIVNEINWTGSSNLTRPEYIALLDQGVNDTQLLVLDHHDDHYAIWAFDLKTNTALGSFTIGEFSEIDEVKTISAMAAEATNFGGLYRSGVIAIVEDQETFALKLSPWGAVRNSLQLEVVDPSSRRSLSYQYPEVDDQLIIPLPSLTGEDG